MFQCPLSGQLCLNHKNFTVYKMVNGHPTKLPVCEGCASQVMQSSPEYQTFAWQNFLNTIFRLMHIDKVLTREEYEYAITNIKNKEELNEFLSMLAQRKQRADQLPPCPSCGIDLANLFQKGQPGCAKCYDHFHDFLKVLIQRVQDQASSHTGKTPATGLEKLQEEMQRAIQEERYEDAAKLRDKIREYKS